MSTIDQVSQKMHSLTPSNQQQILALAEELERRQAGSLKHDPYGCLANYLNSDLSFEEFQQNRREMWGNSTERELEWPG